MPSTSDTPISISVVIICFNQERYITESIESVLEQSAQDCIREIFVVDDKSSDNSVAVAREMAKRDPRIKVIPRETNSGGCAAPRNDAMRLASGSHIAFLDGDDIWLPDKIATQMASLELHPEIGLLFSDFIVFDDETGAERPNVARHYEATDGPDQLRSFFIHGGPIIPSCAIVSRAAMDQVGLFDPDVRFNEDAEYWMRVAAHFPIHHQRKALIRKREWFGSLGSAKYGLENLEWKREITRRALAISPELADVAHKRDAQIAFKMAVHFFKLKETPQARMYLREALSLDPKFRKARLYLGLSYLSTNPEVLINLVRTARAKAPSTLR